MEPMRTTHPPFAVFSELPLTAIQPAGWLRARLRLQASGLTGHLDETGFPFSTPGWGAARIHHEQGTSWWPYEQTAYWVDGMIRCGLLLRSPRLLRKARRQIEYVLRHPDRDGYLGPRHLKGPGAQQRWAHAVFFRALMAHAAATRGGRVAAALRRHYLADDAAVRARGRDICNVEAMLWAYGQTRDPRLLKMAVAAWAAYGRHRHKPLRPGDLLAARRVHCHGVTFMEICKIPALLYQYTGHRHWRRTAERAFDLLDRHHMLVDGVPSSTEYLAGRTPRDSHETCDIADYTWSAGALLLATGDGAYADRIERACFNAAPGAVREDFKALQYFSGPNQVVAAANSNHHTFGWGNQLMSFRPQPGVECCAGNVNRILPNYAARLWLADGQGGLAAPLYAPCAVRARVGARRVPVTIEERTRYPFAETVSFHIAARRPVTFTLRLRVPGWCRRPALAVNGRPVPMEDGAGGFLALRRRFAGGDTVTLTLPMAVRVIRWPGGGVAVERGPLLYALRLPERWRRVSDARSTPRLPAWEARPAAPWNYALALPRRRAAEVIRVVRRRPGPDPWRRDGAPVELRVPAVRVPGWHLIRRHTRRGRVCFTPPLPRRVPARARPAIVRLVPYGCTHLRITLFPVARAGCLDGRRPTS